MRGLTLLLTLLLAACSDSSGGTPDLGPDQGGLVDGALPNPPGGNPLVPEVAAYPFPSDFYLVKDGATATGRRLALPKEVLPRLVVPELFQGVDGFSLIPLILTRLPGGVDPSSLPDPADTVKTDSPVLLVREQTWELVPVLAEVDLTTTLEEQRSLILRPLIALEPDTGYVVLLRDQLRDLAGKAHRPAPAFVALRDGTPTTVAAIEQQREDFKLVSAALAGLTLDPKEVVQAWSFHTRSEAQVTGDLLAMQALINQAPLGRYTITSDKLEPKGDGANRQIEARISMPSFIGTDGLLARDAAGKVKIVGQQEIPFYVTIPSTVDRPRPVLLFGHGFMGSPQQGTRGSFNDLCARYGFSAVSGYIGFNDTLTPLFAKAIADPPNFAQVTASVLQNLASYTYLARLVSERLSEELTVDWGEGPVKPLDGEDVQYLGISNGGTFGYVVAATSPQLSRATLVVGGGGLVHFLQRAVQWNGYGPVLRVVYPDARERELMLSLMQMVIDPMDSMSYARHLVHDRFPGLKPLRAALHMAVNDSQVRNLVTEWVARTAGVPLVTPAPRTILGLQTIGATPPGGAPAGTPAALFVYDEHVKPPPSGNLPPARDNKTHQSVRELWSYQQQVAAFVGQGKLLQLCDGPCDPN